ncbi:hypothetical protein Q6350_02810 [Isoptericola sp. b515]|uniref:hypothetical protein n=1 Tax=Isoptericola sp. b515 TaxID=3064652 RepID=UPI002712C7B2|nr:hypothetical protein [Isoptericola sp. b515]MDO8147353.1 hypothetical protein [Isoptericola sp. b515]
MALDMPGPLEGPGHDPTSSDSPDQGSHLDHLGRFGIDTIDVFVPTTRDAIRELPVQRLLQHLDHATGELSEPVPTTSEVRLANGQQVRALRQAGVHGVLASFSAPKWLRGDNRRPATSDEVRTVVDDFTNLVAEHVPFATPVPEVRLRRVDVARDFVGVAAPAQVLDALTFERPRRPMKTNLYRDKALLGAQTVYRANTRWKARLYHRGEMYQDRSAPASCDPGLAQEEEGIVRFELELRTEVLGELGMARVEALDDARLWSTASKYWGRTRFGATVGSDPKRLRAAEECLSTQELGLVCVHLLFPGRGLARGSRRKAKALAARFGLTRDDLIHSTGAPAGTLDLHRGRFIATESDAADPLP